MTISPGTVVRYTNPTSGEETLTFVVVEDRGNRVLIVSRDFPTARLPPQEVVEPSDIVPVDECDTCAEFKIDVAEREGNGHRQCEACWADALAYGHYHGMHVDEYGNPELVEGCPTCAGRTPDAYRT